MNLTQPAIQPAASLRLSAVACSKSPMYIPLLQSHLFGTPVPALSYGHSPAAAKPGLPRTVVCSVSQFPRGLQVRHRKLEALKPDLMAPRVLHRTRHAHRDSGKLRGECTANMPRFLNDSEPRCSRSYTQSYLLVFIANSGVKFGSGKVRARRQNNAYMAPFFYVLVINIPVFLLGVEL